MRISDWSSDVCSSDLLRLGLAGDAEILAEHPVLSAEQVLEKVLMPLAAGAEQVGAPDEEVAREVLGVVRVLAGETQVAGLQLLQREVGDLLAGGLGSLADLERVGFELRRGGQPAHPLGAHVEVDHAAAPLGRIGQGRRSEERRGGKEGGSTCRSRWLAEHKKKK